MKHPFFYMPFMLLITFSTTVKAYDMRQISNKDNLSNSSITTFCQNERGVMYIGTCDGLNSYNGRQVETFHPQGTDDFLSGNLIDKIIYAGANIYWIQTYYGLNCYHAATGHVQRYDAFRKQFVMTADTCGVVYIVQESNSIYYLHKPSGTFRKLYMSGILFSDIAAFFVDRYNVLWIITRQGNCQCYNIAEHKGEVTLQLLHGATPQWPAIASCFYADDCIFAVSKQGILYQYNIAQQTMHTVANMASEITLRGKITAVAESMNSIFVGFANKGVLAIESDSTGSPTMNDLNIDCGIFCLQKDCFQDLLWIGTDGQGIYLCSQNPYSFKSIILKDQVAGMNHPVRALHLDAEGTLWVGSKGDGILRIKNYDTNRPLNGHDTERLMESNSTLTDDAVYCFAKSLTANVLWIGTEEGLNYYSYRDRRLHTILLPMNSGTFRYIHDIYEDAAGTLWMASVGLGIVSASIGGSTDAPTLSNIRHYTINQGNFESNYFFCIFAENDSTLWFGNRGYGACRFALGHSEEPTPMSFCNKYKNQTLNDVFSICKDTNGHYLFGTSYGLINYESSEKYELFNVENGFLNNTVHAIEKGKNGQFWLSTNRGLVLFNPHNGEVHTFDMASGLQVIEFSDGASFRNAATDMLFFGGVNGFVTMSENRKTTTTEYMPPLFFDKLKIFGEQHNMIDYMHTKRGNKTLRLRYSQNFFSVSFIAVDYLNGGNYTYYYKLDGLSEQWIDNRHSNEIAFTNMPSGNYTLRVKYLNSMAGQESTEYTMNICILPPWYRSLIAKIAYVLILLTLLYSLARWAEQRSRAKKQAMLAGLEKQHQKEVFESKLRFFTNIAHEFCTPLTLIAGPCERILEQKDVNAYVRTCAHMIQANANRLNNLIRELIEFRRIETGNRELHIVPTDTAKIVADTATLFNDMAQSRNIDLSITLPPTLMWNTDCGFFTTIITNLLSNAFKYTPDKRHIRLTLSIEKEQLVFCIANEGHAIKDENVERMFDRYTVLDNFEKNDSGHRFSRNGLGLAISKNMVQLLQGHIEVANTATHEVQFCVVLPPLPESKSKAEQPQANDYVPTVEPVHAPLPLPTTHTDSLKPTLLIIDDEAEMLWLLRDIFINQFNVITLQDTQQITQTLADTYPDLIISDVMMPCTNGIDVVKLIKNNKDTAHIPILLVSGKYEMEEQIEAMTAGAEMYITKPFNADYLRVSVQQILERKEKLKDYFSSPISSFEKQEGKLTHKEDKKLLKDVLRIINENITNTDLSVQLIADKMLLGTRSLYRKMEEAGLESPSNLIRDCRMQMAQDLLLKTKLTIDEIVFKSGFNNKVTFFKAFNKKHGCTPKEFRQQKMDEVK